MRGVQEEQAGWYEASLPLQERRKRGHFSTPPLLVERILDACGYTPAASDLPSIRVLDPACGSGNFLVAAARRLATFATCNNMSQQKLADLVQHNLWGLDPDPISCFLAEMQLSAAIADAGGGVEGEAPAATIAFHIHQADGLALPWQEPCVDLLLANPPYLAAKNTDLSAYHTARQSGQADSYLLFLSLGLRIVRPGGWLGLVLPDPLLARTNAYRQRTRLLEEFTLHHLWHLADVFTAQVGAVVVIAQKRSPAIQHRIAWRREKWRHSLWDDHKNERQEKQKEQDESWDGDKGLGQKEQAERQDDRKGHPYYIDEARDLVARTVPQALFLRQPRAELRYLLSNEYGPTIERLQAYINNAPVSSSGCAPLSHFLTIRRGEELGMKSPYLIQRETEYSRGDPGGRPDADDVQRDTAYNSCPEGNGYADGVSWYPVLRGGKDIRPYAAPRSHWSIAGEAIAKPLERYLSPKLLVVKSTNRLQATLDIEGHVALQTLYLLRLHEHEASVDDLYFYLALLNSRLLRHYVYVLYTAYKWVQPQIEQHVLAQLPVPIVTAHEKQGVIVRAKLLMHACSASGTVVEWKGDIQDMYEEQERALCVLYNTFIG